MFHYWRSLLVGVLLNRLVEASQPSRPSGTPDGQPKLSQVYETTTAISLPNVGNLQVHDPNIIFWDDHYYLFKGGQYIPFFKAANMSGPWTQVGTVLEGESIIHQGNSNRSRPWAPTTVERNGTFYCYYTLSTSGSQKSAIGVATSTTLDGSSWIDHGAVIRTGEGNGSDIWPFTVTNAIDASFVQDNLTGKAYLNYGSFWHDIWQVPLTDDWLSIESPQKPDARQLTFIPHKVVRPQEGSWMSYRDGYYYVWFSHGRCCNFDKRGFPDRGNEYSIRVGRSRDVRGPFVDRTGKSLLDGGGTIVYASNHGLVYAPGGVGVLSGSSSTLDLLYYHYLNTSVGFRDDQAQLGYSYLQYYHGWPVVLDGIVAQSGAAGAFRLRDPWSITLCFGFWIYVICRG
ncbi:Arabinan endo-1,5-alpha-L-arabinanase [Penicillium ucsense]|uniref:Arabinan endo-1,5-alpha-L-arabinosidase n=1 Tax=Penicillium ucsense TaxID=2839758 RepID=A0A8J8W2Z2_9EURO|nr:Arabinan endo-1,5-alpha-L-arabinanase [Penicillium ucsense]KAF7737662.1 Arabinan endo-1,5-alpha-L-arabinanase [Penicillium ucsense]